MDLNIKFHIYVIFSKEQKFFLKFGFSSIAITTGTRTLSGGIGCQLCQKCQNIGKPVVCSSRGGGGKGAGVCSRD